MYDRISCKMANQIDLVDYLKKLGHQPKKIRNQDYWYLSPFRQEKTASFKVDRNRNIWYDFGENRGGNFVEFGLRFFDCSVAQLLEKLSQLSTPHFSFHAPVWAAEKKVPGEGKILIMDERRLATKSLLRYLDKRCIPLEVAEQFCKEIEFRLLGKKFVAIGFQNNAGGYELRNPYFKSSSSPKRITFIDNGSDQIAVFEGFFDFLSFRTINRIQVAPLSNFLVLNSLSFFRQSRYKMEEHKKIHLFLDRDNAGINLTLEALKWDKAKYIDRSHFYHNHKDLNDWLVDGGLNISQSLRKGRGL